MVIFCCYYEKINNARRTDNEKESRPVENHGSTILAVTKKTEAGLIWLRIGTSGGLL
jgi:hypothetical protein